MHTPKARPASTLWLTCTFVTHKHTSKHTRHLCLHACGPQLQRGEKKASSAPAAPAACAGIGLSCWLLSSTWLALAAPLGLGCIGGAALLWGKRCALSLLPGARCPPGVSRTLSASVHSWGLAKQYTCMHVCTCVCAHVCFDVCVFTCHSACVIVCA